MGHLMDAELLAALQDRHEHDTYRYRKTHLGAQQVNLQRNGQEYLSFCSNDYLGLANDLRVKDAFQNAVTEYGVGSGASHLVNGHTEAHHKLEQELAEFTGRERVLLFSTGYMANLGVINALVGKQDAVFQDRLNHASLIDGALLSRAKLIRYRHNDLADLERSLSKSTHSRKLIVTDGVFSMDGDQACLSGLCHLAEQYRAWLMVDDAHGFGCYGSQGGGLAEQLQLGSDRLPILMGTLGKAFGSFGAFVAGSHTLIETLIQFSRTYIYTTALPPAVAEATRVSLQILREEQSRRERLTKLIEHFRHYGAELGLPLMPSDSPIQPILVGEPGKALRLSQHLEANGFWVTAIRPPTVPVGTARLRITLTSEHSLDQVTALLNCLAEAYDAEPY
ncbi:MAG: 8-amino-7-oxononanoate synthase [Alteromonadaceae bacterium]|nr:MAG: 8-amino-7-oxononanoate synthase [Alteromonadaceae bacterium]